MILALPLKGINDLLKSFLIMDKCQKNSYLIGGNTAQKEE